MKLKVLNILASLFITACAITSCLDEGNMDYVLSSNAAIKKFGIKDSIITNYKTVLNGVDTTLSAVVVGKDYPFTIDQVEGRIYNADSLPKGTDISKVVIDMTIEAYNVMIQAETDSVWQPEDSLNFEKPIVFKLYSQTGLHGKTYTAQINVHQQDPEEMTWTQMAGNFPRLQAQKAIYLNGNVYVFAEQENQVAMTMTAANNGKEWTALQNLDIPTKADYASVLAWNNYLYIIAEDGLYTSANGLNWEKVNTSQNLARLLAAIDGKKLIAADAEGHYMESTDGMEWKVYESLPEGFPKAHTAFESYALDTNEDINRVVLLECNEEKTDSVTTAWMQLDTDNDWSEIMSEKAIYACPRLENAAMIRYNGKLYTFGGPGRRSSALAAFDKLFCSEDNGITWKIVNESILFPEDFESKYEAAHGNYSYTVDDNHFIWIMWGETGEVWKGRLNKLGFVRK